MQASTDTSQYDPGNCNIGREEISRRYRIGYLGLALTLIGIALIEGLNSPPSRRLLISIPVALSLVGFLQARARFCLRYGFMGVFGMTGLRNIHRVKNDDYRHRDRRKAIVLVLQVILGTAIVTLLYYMFGRV